MLSHVTFTGWDRHTELDELENFCGDHEQDRIEIAVLYSATRSANDDDRYPEVRKAVEIMRAAKATGQRSAVHLCGSVARDLLTSAAIEPVSISYPGIVAPLIELADRIQINVGEDFWQASGHERYHQAHIAAKALSRPVILQSRQIAGWPDSDRMVPFLFDRSAGAGVESLAWPRPVFGRLVGYAGGLGPDNVAELCSWLAETAGARVWLDMETRIRSPFDLADRRPDEPPSPTYVSIAKCRAVMRAVDRYIRAL